MGGTSPKRIELRVRCGCRRGTHGRSGCLRSADILGQHTGQVFWRWFLRGRTADAGHPRRGVRPMILRRQERSLKFQELILRLVEVGTNPRELCHGA